MASTERTLARATRRGRRSLLSIGEEFREARFSAGASQASVSEAAGLSRPRYSRIEAGTVETLRILEAARIAGVLGLDLSVRVYPGAGPLRDAAHAGRLDLLLAHAAAPLRVDREVPLPAREAVPEQRAWDAIVRGSGRRTAIELEMRLRDAQATERRLTLKRRDDPTDSFVLVIAGTKTNRRILREHPGLFGDLPRVRPRRVIDQMRAGLHPPSALIVL